MLTDDELAAMREQLAASLPDTCVILRTTAGTADGAGGYTGGTTSAAGTVACRVSPYPPIMDTERVAAGQQGVIEFWSITMPVGTDVLPTDRLTSNGETFEITGAPTPRSWELSIRILAKKVT